MKPFVLSFIVLSFLIQNITCISLDETNSNGEDKNNKKPIDTLSEKFHGKDKDSKA